MARFILTGDIIHAGRVSVEANTLTGALRLAAKGDFTVFEETHKGLVFEFCGDTEGGVEKVGEPSAQDIRILGKKAAKRGAAIAPTLPKLDAEQGPWLHGVKRNAGE
jgi:hypothetical protein